MKHKLCEWANEDKVCVTLQVGEWAEHEDYGGSQETGPGQAINADAQC